MDSFPDLSRRPALKTRTGLAVDPTLRDPMQDGGEATSLQFPRGRRQWDYTIEHMTWDDYRILEDFVRNTVGYGSKPFYFTDGRDKKNPVQLVVTFSVCPSYSDSAAGEGIAQTCTFQIREQ